MEDGNPHATHHLCRIKRFRQDIISSPIECFGPKKIVSMERGDDHQRRTGPSLNFHEHLPSRVRREIAFTDDEPDSVETQQFHRIRHRRCVENRPWEDFCQGHMIVRTGAQRKNIDSSMHDRSPYSGGGGGKDSAIKTTLRSPTCRNNHAIALRPNRDVASRTV